MVHTLYNKLDLKIIRRKLRREMPKAEVVLWSFLKGKQRGYKFRRQHSIGPYIVDFYCPARRLVIEVDGETHFTKMQEATDRRREDFFKAHGISCLRFLNTDVLENIRGVVERLDILLAKNP